MSYLNFKSKYDKDPILNMSLENKLYRNEKLIKELSKFKKGTIVFETYPGIDLDVLRSNILEHLTPQLIINIQDYAKSGEEINQLLNSHITEDRVFGIYSHHTIKDLYDQNVINTLNEKTKSVDGLTIIYGFGASQIKSDVLIHVSLTRWEIQLRYRKGLSNFRVENKNEDILRKYKRAFFIEWRIADRIKEDIYKKLDYVIDYNDLNNPIMITSIDYKEALSKVTKMPFRMVPYFDPGVWGGQWMKEVCGLDKEKPNFAWSFDGVPEENSIKFRFGNDVIHLPAQDVVQFYPKELMGSRVHARFGKMFPIRFDLLDTMGGGNLSLQVHPLTEYIFDKFGMTYTQDESYYILDASDDAYIYLGFKEDIKQDEFEEALIRADKGIEVLDDNKYINKFLTKKHDHFLIPGGTIHCSGKDTMVLEISAANYIFTFKLWDWDRLGMDGKRRPVHLEHGFKNLQYDRTTKWVKENLVNQIEKIDEHTEITGLHEREFLKTIRYKFNKPYHFKNDQTVMMANLVEGKGMLIKSPNNKFMPYEIHYAETFIIPAMVDEVIFEPLDDEEIMIITAKVR